MRDYLAALAGAALLALACGGGDEGPRAAAGGGDGEPVYPEVDGIEYDVTLSVVDSIGVELGDSNYVFGQPAAADFTPSGDIVVMDMQLSEVRVYDAEGGFLRSFGRKGSGPGEFQMASMLDVAPSGEIVVCDAMGQKLVFFGPDGEYRDALEGFFPAPPVMIDALDSAVVGIQPAFEQTEDGIFSGMALCRWEGEVSPVVTYHQDLKPFDPENMMTDMMEDMMVFEAAPDGRVFRSSIGSERFVLVGYEPDGTEFLRIEEGIEPVPKTEEELAEEIELMRSRFVQGGAPPEIADGYQPAPNRPSVAGLLLDDEGLLWVMLGTTETPAFFVLDGSGQRRLMAGLDYQGDAGNWSFTAMQGGRMLAVDVNPAVYPKVYILEVQE